ncbi:FAD-dependent monooxygenase [Colwellia sp. MB02u-18]|uniref:FAD-dependent oxidoreductase n=1 Tax=unclassified Colwellia TaxID=196834 RepID=UPI0015F5CA38|nr:MULTISPECIES: NAD(P)/FAD-dependent oxidoreductase [unclassified Colwellia]MBA6223931.1 FAD-dependent monooxygenase [Colwellia sp. MB3u-45]MBA6267362.1 FAD-dependent monooxygenase [Colwellia sp. MB3u-43]MBA6320112.1 FAD-dependent monooxygenase [Colwellia sp. MB02u-19]MBA6324818.1 FAD-dependent monooxygenase [Colwellia sp. MB02u-18]MBA6330499.1 FAD-dependent monooxygenase [Colwellia sp. MB02u-12]
MSVREQITIAGAGPVGTLLAVLLARQGYAVNLFESRPDSRNHNIYQGKSINIALSDRGWLALAVVGIEAEIKQHAIAMHKRVMHAIDGTITEQAYGQENQAIWSVSRSGINEQLLDLAEQEPLINVRFEQRLVALDFSDASASFSHDHKLEKISADILFGADGAFSKVRRLAQDTPGFSSSQSYMPQSYIELNIPANDDGSFKIAKNALHIWPRKTFMLIALPNPDGSFTCTLFLDAEGEVSFSSLTHRAEVTAFFTENFADALPLMENPIDDFLNKTASPLFLLNIDPWVINNTVALIGDSAHTMVPFYGQGMNCGFEDCRVLNELITEYQQDWSKIFPAYQVARKINADAISELAKRNFVEMSELSGQARFLLQKKIEAEFHQRHPTLWTPLYTMVTFSPLLPYSQALALGDIQQEIMQKIMQISNIEKSWQADFVYEELWQLAQAAFGAGHTDLVNQKNLTDYAKG